MKQNFVLHRGDALEVLERLSDNSIEAVVTDPPYELGFMGKSWDRTGIAYCVALWAQVLRVLKPGGHLLAFGGTRTYHRMVVAIEDAGFQIRDQIQWLYGSGFPKSLDVSKAIDREAGAKRKVIGSRKTNDIRGSSINGEYRPLSKGKPSMDFQVTVPATATAKAWHGWGTALKPANEPICLARKPLSEKTVARNVQKWGTGGINIDGGRILASDQVSLEKNWDRVQSTQNKHRAIAREGGDLKAIDLRDRAPIGRFPANLILDEVAAEMLDRQSGNLHGAGAARGGGKAKQAGSGGLLGVGNHDGNGMRFGDQGGASRFFYCAKASKRERNAGLEGMPEKSTHVRAGANNPSPNRKLRDDNFTQNTHPTVKPVSLMRYLIRLVTPPGGRVLDPFAGSGTTGVACRLEGFEFVGIEREPAYARIARKRISAAKRRL